MGGRIHITEADLQLILSSLAYRQRRLQKILYDDPEIKDAQVIGETLRHCQQLNIKIRQARNAQL